ncbi:hypothetical protein HDU87_003997 [Geranomyces variabilis]|uniref:BTB domain-containing protein n=1 Tax=Geranomyces variabilis TaxID=109894 RepID=A0AAD5TVP1_9FUNG|nr:hypothetical protein HDU87_003997 [Geranomyces variabilis]
MSSKPRQQQVSPPRQSALAVASLLTEHSRSLELAVTNFSKVRVDQTFSYGATPFLICSERKWGVNLYPFGLKPGSRDYGSRIDVYLHIWARDSRESEASFKEWIKNNKVCNDMLDNKMWPTSYVVLTLDRFQVNFTITVTEPSPAALHVVSSSRHCWCDMEDAAGWWKLSLKASPKLLDLNQDSLIIRIAFGDTAPDVAAGGTDMMPLPASLGSANQAGLPIGLFDNPHVSDFTIWAGHAGSEFRALHVQQCVLEGRLPRWAEFRAWSQSASPVISNKHRPTLGTLPASGSASSATTPAGAGEGEPHVGPSSACIAGVPYDVTHAFLTHIYTWVSPSVACTARDYAYLHLLAEAFGLRRLAKACRRMVFALLTQADAVFMLLLFGGRSRGLEALISSWIVQNWTDVRPSEAFRRLYEHPTRNGTARLLAVLRRMKIAPTRLSSPSINDDSKPGVPLHTMDGPRYAAFSTLLDNPAASDVHFIVEGRRITAQKSVLVSLSDYFSAMFCSGFAEAVHDGDDKDSGPTIVNIPDFSYATIHNLLLFLYTGRLDPPRTAAAMGDLFIVGDKYQVPELSDLAHAMLRREMRSDGVAEFLFRFAKYPALRDLVLEILVRDFDAVKHTKGFAAALTEGFDDCYDWSGLVETIVDRLVVTSLDTAHDPGLSNDTNQDEDFERFDWDKLADEGGQTEADATASSAAEEDDAEDDDDDDEDEIYKDAQSHHASEVSQQSQQQPSPTTMAARDSDSSASPPPGKRHAVDDESVRRPDHPPEATPQSPRRAAGLDSAGV